MYKIILQGFFTFIFFFFFIFLFFSFCIFDFFTCFDVFLIFCFSCFSIFVVIFEIFLNFHFHHFLFRKIVKKLSLPLPDPPPPDLPKFRSFVPSPAPIFALSLSLGVFSLNFGGVFEGRDNQTCTFGLSGCRVKPVTGLHDRPLWERQQIGSNMCEKQNHEENRTSHVTLLKRNSSQAVRTHKAHRGSIEQVGRRRRSIT